MGHAIGSAASAATPAGHLERFDVADQGGRLIDAEHRGRYWWAAQVAAGKDVLDAACGTGYGSRILSDAGAKSVTGVDISAEAVEATAERLGDRGTALAADLRELPLEDDSVDLVVSWETIEHVEDGARVIAEFRRVLRPDGLLLISSPNPDVYPPGNEHHVHEYRAAELEALVGERFSNLSTYRQKVWLASVIQSPEGAVHDAFESKDPEQCATRAIERLEDGRETYAAIVASDAALPGFEDLITLGNSFEVQWWEEQLIATRKLLAQVEARESEVVARLGETSAELLEAEQSLTQMPLLTHRVHELHGTLVSMERSLSWRLTAPLRRLRRLQRR